jgi:hypothetical protein
MTRVDELAVTDVRDVTDETSKEMDSKLIVKVERESQDRGVVLGD